MKITFQILAILLFNLIVIGKLFIFNKKSALVVDKYVMFTTIILTFYCICSFLFIFNVNFLSKLFYLFFGLSPFLIGKLITYKTRDFYTYLQLIIFLFSGIFVRYL